MSLTEVLRQYDLELDDKKIETLERFADFLVSSPVNLTSLGKEDIYHKVVAEALYPLRDFPILEGFIDVGTGGGVPGVVIGVAFDVKGILVDSRKKKVSMLRSFIDKENLNLEAVWSRAEDLAKDKNHREKYMYSFAKAVSSIKIDLEILAPLTMVGGYVLLYKGPAWKEEMEDLWDFMEEMGVDLGDAVEYELLTGEKRALLIFEKFKSTPKKYPRRSKR